MRKFVITEIATGKTQTMFAETLRGDLANAAVYSVVETDGNAEWAAIQADETDRKDLLANALTWLDANVGNATTNAQALQELKNIRAYLKRLTRHTAMRL